MADQEQVTVALVLEIPPIDLSVPPRKCVNGGGLKLQGDLGELHCMARCVAAGYEIVRPAEGKKYDVGIINKKASLKTSDGVIMHRIQCKTATQCESNGKYAVELRGRNGKGQKTPIDPAQYDSLYTELADGRIYFMPSKDIGKCGRITLGGPESEKYCIEKSHLDKRMDAVNDALNKGLISKEAHAYIRKTNEEVLSRTLNIPAPKPRRNRSKKKVLKDVNLPSEPLAREATEAQAA